jgi:hypothetical protein
MEHVRRSTTQLKEKDKQKRKKKGRIYRDSYRRAESSYEGQDEEAARWTLASARIAVRVKLPAVATPRAAAAVAASCAAVLTLAAARDDAAFAPTASAIRAVAVAAAVAFAAVTVVALAFDAAAVLVLVVRSGGVLRVRVAVGPRRAARRGRPQGVEAEVGVRGRVGVVGEGRPENGKECFKKFDR